MSHKSDVNLGIELATVYNAGQKILPAVAHDYQAAWEAIPYSVALQTTRAGGIGDDPGPVFDHVLDRINKMINDTSAVLSDVGNALVYAANQLAEADATVKKTFEDKSKALGEVS